MRVHHFPKDVKYVAFVKEEIASRKIDNIITSLTAYYSRCFAFNSKEELERWVASRSKLDLCDIFQVDRLNVKVNVEIDFD